MGSLNPPMSSSCVYTPEPSSPLFLLSSDVPGVSLMAVPFSGNGFGGWKRSMIISLCARNKISFIDGTCVRPPENSPQFRQWDHGNNIFISWLTNSLSPDIAESVQYSDTAESIWKKLNNRHGTVNGTKVFELKRELASTYQGSFDIPSYFNKLKKIWDELEAIRSSHAHSCNCAAKEGLQKERKEDKVHQFLMGLNEVYVGVRSNLLMMHLLPSLDSPQQKQYSQRVFFDQSKSGFFCKYCKKTGHLIDKCYKLNGFLQNFKFAKGRKPAANMAEQGFVVHGVTQQQYAQLISLLQQTHISDSRPSLNTKFC
ncbi:PREDICTED: uncharacterized protein LOC109209890 [Nicotiana attenuata]|uniref:uncharacterized protein LOC109209890 n=1 Tax=Nicotiana attenuata TaxID=49451 RepID=UPI000905B41A|nr:PREDICTED: uncharacterized protein LOC109209890 [Nicotiana attenuata]